VCRARLADLILRDQRLRAHRLAPYGVHMRYGTSHSQGLDREQALHWAKAAIEWAQSIIESQRT